ncbi:MAG: hypothetical protein ACMG57_04640, partial [Candidatus Dojkabacteria bacterium]
SNVDPSSLNYIEKFDKGYIDGTSIFLNEGYLPEEYGNNAVRLGQISGKLGLEIATKAKIFQEKMCIYSLSNISDFEKEKIYPDNKSLEILSGDERFIFSKEALYTELLGLKRAIKYFECDNISFSIPALRNYDNFKKILLNIDDFSLFSKDEKIPVFAEISIPSILFTINQFTDKDIAGFLVDYDILIRLSVNRENLRDSDHDVAYEQVKIIAENAKRIGIPVYIKMFDINKIALTKLQELDPTGFIFSAFPEEAITDIL